MNEFFKYSYIMSRLYWFCIIPQQLPSSLSRSCRFNIKDISSFSNIVVTLLDEDTFIFILFKSFLWCKRTLNRAICVVLVSHASSKSNCYICLSLSREAVGMKTMCFKIEVHRKFQRKSYCRIMFNSIMFCRGILETSCYM